MSAGFTSSRDEVAEARVARDLANIRDELVATLGASVKALLVRGRYGQGEALVVVEGGKGWPVCDYDIVVIAREPIAPATLAPLAARLSDIVKVVRVRLQAFTGDELAGLDPSLLAHELSAGSRLFHGSPDALERMPKVDPALIPLLDARAMLLDRTGNLLECIGEQDFDTELGADDGFRIVLGASEAILAAAEALLIEAGDDRASLSARLERFGLRFPSWPALAALITQATRLQLTGRPPDAPPIRFWLDARRFFLSALFRVTCKVHETPLYDWWDLLAYLESSAVFDLGQMLALLFKPSLWRETQRSHRRMRLSLARLAVLLARSARTRIDQEFLAKARALLQKATGDVPPSSWDAVRSAAIRADVP